MKFDGHDILAIVIVIVLGVLIGLGRDSALTNAICAIALAFLVHGGYTKLKKK